MAEVLRDGTDPIPIFQQSSHSADGRRPKLPLCLLGDIAGDLREASLLGRRDGNKAGPLGDQSAATGRRG
jgi:hypothetical protein